MFSACFFAILGFNVNASLRLVQPESGTFAGPTHFVFETNEQAGDILGLEVLVNGQMAHYFEEPPFEAEIDFRRFAQGKIKVKAILTLFDGKKHQITMEGTNHPYFFQEDVNLVRIPVMVQLGDGFREFGLKDFLLAENGAPQKPSSLFNKEQPIDLLVLLDLSGSMEYRIPILKVGMIRFLNQLRPKDRIQIIGFNHQVFEISPSETDKELVKQRMGRIEADGATNLYGAVYSGIKILGNSDMRRAVMVFTDGHHDTDNEVDIYKKTEQDCIDLSREVGVPLYTMGVGSGVKPDVLRNLADQTGGKFFFLNSSRALRHAFTTVGGELRHQYLLCYQTRSKKVGWHQISVAVPNAPQAVLRYPKKLYFR